MAITAKKKLLIVESPAKARTIGQYLGSGYEVLASVGHVRDLPKSNKDAVDVENGFKPKYVVSADKRDVIEKIKKAASKASEVFLATDPDREGEAISWHIQQAVGLKDPKRVVFHEITKEAVEEAGYEIIKHVQKLPNIKKNKQALEQLISVYKETYDKKNPIRNSAFFINNIPIIKEIEENFSKSK